MKSIKNQSYLEMYSETAWMWVELANLTVAQTHQGKEPYPNSGQFGG